MCKPIDEDELLRNRHLDQILEMGNFYDNKLRKIMLMLKMLLARKFKHVCKQIKYFASYVWRYCNI